MEIEKKKEKCLLSADSNKLLVTFLEAFKLKRQHLEESVESNDMGLRMDQDRGLNKSRKKHNTDTDPNTGKNRSRPIFRYSSEFRYCSCTWQTIKYK